MEEEYVKLIHPIVFVRNMVLHLEDVANRILKEGFSVSQDVTSQYRFLNSLSHNATSIKSQLRELGSALIIDKKGLLIDPSNVVSYIPIEGSDEHGKNLLDILIEHEKKKTSQTSQNVVIDFGLLSQKVTTVDTYIQTQIKEYSKTNHLVTNLAFKEIEKGFTQILQLIGVLKADIVFVINEDSKILTLEKKVSKNNPVVIAVGKELKKSKKVLKVKSEGIFRNNSSKRRNFRVVR